MKYYLQSHYDIEKTAKRFNTTSNAIQVAVTYASNRLKMKIGHDTIDEVLAGEIDVAMKNFYLLSSMGYRNADLFSTELLGWLPEPKNNPYTLAECARELIYLTTFSTKNMFTYFGGLEPSKLAFIMSVLKSANDDADLLSKLFGGAYQETAGNTKTSPPLDQVKLFLKLVTELNVYE